MSTCSSDLIVILRRGSHSAATQLRVIPLCEPSFLEVLLARGVTLWVPTHAPQTLVTRPGGVSTFLSYHACGSPLVMALSWVVSVPGSPSSGVDTSRVRISLLVLELMALKPPFSSPCYCSGLSRPEASFWRLCLAMPLLGDASLGRWPSEAMTRSVNLLTFFLGFLEGSHHVLTLTFGQRPGTGRYSFQPFLKHLSIKQSVVSTKQQIFFT